MALGCGGGINAGSLIHAHLGRLVELAATLPRTADQNFTAACCPACVYRAGSTQLNAVACQHNAPTFFGETAGFELAAVANHAALQFLRGAGRHDNAAIWRVDCMMVFHQCS